MIDNLGGVVRGGLLLLALVLLRRFIEWRRAAASVNNLGGFRTLFSERFIWFPFRVAGISPGVQSEENLYRKHKDFEEVGWDIMAGVSFWPNAEVTLSLADPAVIKDVIGARARFPKPMGPYKILLAFGPNLVASEGDEWKRQRKLVAPAFSELMFPTWALRWGTPLMRSFYIASNELQNYMQEMIVARRTAEVKEERHDLFSSLLDANEGFAESGEKLSDTGLLGNVFIFMVAGYETSAHTLAYSFILLALYQEEQEKFYQNIKQTLGDGRTPSYEEFSTLSYSMAVFNETLRLFPPVITIPKQSAEDTSFTTTNAAGEKRTIPVPKGTYVTVHTPGIHNNPKYWEDPDAFKPERFLKDYPRDCFLPFSGGPRGCIGRGFSETESIAVLTLLVARYRVEVRDEPQFAGESFAQRRARLLKSKLSVTL
ncbi:cytochrome P450 [Ganoderma sinense ZZ0214-1]|uniref:Cytochrome P450 n=1 Tax=Ganoderma sinense ZZ0214-1 TaxID=1077348 RepID=A0A2G8RPR7_9APHY|nr:cytochrome P450 [Ganoderma sinense ZZ0214-1]